MGKIFTVKNVVFMGLLTALAAVLHAVGTINVTEQLQISFSYIPNAMGSALFGPAAGAVVGVAIDVITFIVKPSGFFFPGFTLSAVLTNVIYGLFLYKKEIKLWRVVTAQLIILIVINLGLTPLWLNMMYGTPAGTLYSFERFARNIIEFPVKVGLIMFFVKLALKAYDKN